MASPVSWTAEISTEFQTRSYGSESVATSAAVGPPSAPGFVQSYNIALLFLGVMGTLVSVFVLVGIWLSDRSKVNTSSIYIANHTTLET